MILSIFGYYLYIMRLGISLFLVCMLCISCIAEFVPQTANDRDENALILPTEDPNGRSGEVAATFLSSQSKFYFSESNMSSETFQVSYVTTAKNFDIFKWVFEGGYTDVGSSTTSSGTTTIAGSLDDPTTAGQVAVLIEYRDGFGRYDVTHAVANSTDVDVNTKKDFVTYEYVDDLQVLSSNTTVTTGWENPEEGWFSTATSATQTFASCDDSMVGYYEVSDSLVGEPSHLIKEFSNFGSSPKNLIFEYKMDFLILPSTNEDSKKLALGYTPIVSGSSSFAIEPSELWSESRLNVTEFRQVIIPLPLIPNFRITFTKYPSPLNSRGVERYPYNICIRNVKIIPANED